MTMQPSRPPERDPSLSVEDQSADLGEVTRLAMEVPRRPLGATGLNRSAGYVTEEFLPALKGQKAVQVYREMLANSPLIGASVSTIEMLLKNVAWEVVAPDDSDLSKQAEDLVRHSMENMDTSWGDFIGEALSFIWYGWAFFETTYKRTEYGVCWKDLSVRAQDTLVRWVFDDYGRAVGMVQSSAPRWEFKTIPFERGLHVMNRSRKRNPEGVSALRNAYEPWYYAKRIMQIEAVGLERDLAGLPVMWVPSDLLRDAEKNPVKKKQLAQFTKLVRSVRRDSNEGLVLPLEYDSDTKQKRYDLQLLSSGGGRQFDTNRIVERYEMRMLQAMMTDFIMLGALSATGSYAMHLDKTGILRASLNGHAQQIAEALNRQAIPKLMLLNSIPQENWPKFVPSDSDAPNLAELSSFMASMSQLGMQFFPDADMEAFVRKAARMPEMSDEERRIRTEEKRKSDVGTFMRIQSDMLQEKVRVREMLAQNDTSQEIASDPAVEARFKVQQARQAGMDMTDMVTEGEFSDGAAGGPGGGGQPPEQQPPQAGPQG